MHPRSRPLRPVAIEIRDWIIEQMRNDVLAIDRLYPRLGLQRLVIKSVPVESRYSNSFKALETSASMVYRVRKQLVEEGYEAVLSRKQRATPAVARIFDGEKEAKLIALACTKPPKGRARWTCGCWRKRSRNCKPPIAPATDDRAGTKKNILQRHRQQCWVNEPKANGAFVAAMEDVLAVYTRPRDADYPLVCLDETAKQYLAETRLTDR